MNVTSFLTQKGVFPTIALNGTFILSTTAGGADKSLNSARMNGIMINYGKIAKGTLEKLVVLLSCSF